MKADQDVMKKRYRADVYRYLSACFCLPQKELFAQENLIGRLKVALKEMCSDSVCFATEMEKAFQESQEEDLRVEYARLFVGPYELQAPPYGSVYLDGERKLMGPSTLEVVKLYEKAGLVIDQDLKELPDHIALELEFMSYLLSREAESLDQPDQKLAAQFRDLTTHFFEKYLNPWIFPFCQKIKEGSEHPFYIALANCLSTFATQQNRD